MKLMAWCLLAAVVMLAVGCTSSTGGPSATEPPFVGVANLTGAPIKQASISKVGDPSRGGSFGSVSPVPVGAMQLFERRTNRPKLPSKIQITWITAYGKTQTREVSLREALDQSTGAPNEALIIELRIDSVVAALRTLQ